MKVHQMLGLILAGVVGGMISHWSFGNDTAAAQRVESGSSAKELVIKDKNGKTRIRLYVDDSEHACFEMNNAEEKVCYKTTVAPDSKASSAAVATTYSRPGDEGSNCQIVLWNDGSTKFSVGRGSGFFEIVRTSKDSKVKARLLDESLNEAWAAGSK